MSLCSAVWKQRTADSLSVCFAVRECVCVLVCVGGWLASCQGECAVSACCHVCVRVCAHLFVCLDLSVRFCVSVYEYSRVFVYVCVFLIFCVCVPSVCVCVSEWGIISI